MSITYKLYYELLAGRESLSVIGLGYVGMPLAVSFANHVSVIGFDLNKGKIDGYKSGIDFTNEVGNEAVRNTTVEFTTDETQLKRAKFHIVAVPTPVNQDKTPDLFPVENASRILGRNLTKGSIVVYESTVYPGVTEDICVPILEEESGLKCGSDFSVGYSPERINPGDQVHRLENIVKIVSACDKDSLEQVAKIYGIICKGGTHKVSSIKVAEAAKVVENSQRDINIAFMNELAMVFDKMNINTAEVVNAMNTKWNALGFRPGLVGGHCIGVDPYYFIYKAENLGYHSQIVSSGRKINDGMGAFIADAAIKQLTLADFSPKTSKVVILGLTFKENCPDIRNSKVADIIERLKEYGIIPEIVDPWADKAETLREYKISLSNLDDIKNADCLIFAVAHEQFKNLTIEQINAMYSHCGENKRVLIDVKGIFSEKDINALGYRYWSL